jgi:adenosylcobinamide-phosphate synthase
MTFLSILFALLIEQAKPLRAENPIYGAVKALAVRVEGWFNAGQVHHGRVSWLAMIAAFTLPTILVYWLCTKISPFLAFAWSVVIIYLTLGFRHYSHYFTSIQLALHNGDEDTARGLLAEWTKQDTRGLSSGDITRVAIEKALITSHRHVFGVFFWLLMPLGPAGAVLYRVAEYLARTWNEPDNLRNEKFGQFALRAFYWIDWIPARLTAAAFAVVGNFEDAIYAWRNFAGRWKNETTGIILTAGGGAMGVRLGTPAEMAVNLLPSDAMGGDAAAFEPEISPGEPPGLRGLQSTVGLVWRSLLLWMLLLLLVSIAAWLG